MCETTLSESISQHCSFTQILHSHFITATSNVGGALKVLLHYITVSNAAFGVFDLLLSPKLILNKKINDCSHLKCTSFIYSYVMTTL